MASIVQSGEPQLMSSVQETALLRNNEQLLRSLYNCMVANGKAVLYKGSDEERVCLLKSLEGSFEGAELVNDDLVVFVDCSYIGNDLVANIRQTIHAKLQYFVKKDAGRHTDLEECITRFEQEVDSEEQLWFLLKYIQLNYEGVEKFTFLLHNADRLVSHPQQSRMNLKSLYDKSLPSKFRGTLIRNENSFPQLEKDLNTSFLFSSAYEKAGDLLELQGTFSGLLRNLYAIVPTTAQKVIETIT